MRLERQRGQVDKMRAVEAAHEELTERYKPYWQIAAELYHRHPSQATVQQLIKQRYGVEISEKTAGSWINRGHEELRRQQEIGTPEQPSAEAEAHAA